MPCKHPDCDNNVNPGRMYCSGQHYRDHLKMIRMATPSGRKFDLGSTTQDRYASIDERDEDLLTNDLEEIRK